MINRIICFVLGHKPSTLHAYPYPPHQNNVTHSIATVNQPGKKRVRCQRCSRYGWRGSHIKWDSV